jgi:Uri superfamily endonuclease
LLPDAPGIYGLGFTVLENRIITVGSLGECQFYSGRYIYFGSAKGPGGLYSRIRHHLLPKKKLNWHIDYLHIDKSYDFLWYLIGGEFMECEWSQSIGQLDKFEYPIRRFGSSDCQSGCAAHLLKVPEEYTNEMIGIELMGVYGNSDLPNLDRDLLSKYLI